jgi:ParB family transcriptional regulator, chromosome partitioning protein
MNSFKVLTSSQSGEWYTPSNIIEAARATMGGIDLDPASSADANKIVQARVFYTKEDDGMKQHWRGNVWMNPPYGNKSAGNYGVTAWVNKLYYSYTEGEVWQAIVLLRGDSEGVRRLTKEFIFCDSKRIAFHQPGKQKSMPVPGSRIFYLGARTNSFVDNFENFGTILKAHGS